MKDHLDESGASFGKEPRLQPIFISQPDPSEEVCCGPPAGPPSGPFEKPGYKLLGFVDSFLQTQAGPVPKVKTRPGLSDVIGTVAVRLGIGRNDYKIAPGLYCIGDPDDSSPVMVTANYKLSFDTLRKDLEEVSAWVLVLDTRGINVWCAAGKGTFSTDEVIRLIKLTHLDKIVKHRNLILPQLSATGVSATRVKKASGFSVIWGPVRTNDIKLFLKNGLKAEKSWRTVTFSFVERFVLVPVELSLVIKSALWILLAVLIISGIGPGIFSISSSISRGFIAAMALLSGILAGAVAVPLFLPWIPFRAFSVKGAIMGIIAGLVVVFALMEEIQLVSTIGILLLTAAVSSYLAMNFTGATPFTSPSGVEKEMRKAIPLQAAAILIGISAWVIDSFINKGIT
ncbi:MAG: hypothetical protein JRJ39_15180 [Deltaproteobacteria bacterium]|nr:hypothetical protein [Deltaproteobacteria bacterium]MBW1814953.1 hypothetical protein [Deltaproteobacteria bacterium]MBW1848215.1 hypothetical protein [Deltaproteobacteria bacterium]MBW1983467.1 hypothetical protein [Deltaproteobacteria bacterium]